MRTPRRQNRQFVPTLDGLPPRIAPCCVVVAVGGLQGPTDTGVVTTQTGGGDLGGPTTT